MVPLTKLPWLSILTIKAKAFIQKKSRVLKLLTTLKVSQIKSLLGTNPVALCRLYFAYIYIYV